MAQIFAKSKLSGVTAVHLSVMSTDPLTPTEVHTGPTDTTKQHEVWLYAANLDSVDRVLTLVVGTSDILKVTIPARDGDYQILAGRLIPANATAGHVLGAAADLADVIMLSGHVHEITTTE